MVPALLAAALASVQGYVFRESDGGPPRRPLTVELISEGRSRYREATRPDGAFEFDKVREGRYTIRARYDTFVVNEDTIAVSAGGPNFAAVMIPKRRGGPGTPFGTVSVTQLAARNDREYQKKIREAARLAQARQFSEAVQAYEQAVEKYPSAELLDALALLCWQLGRKEEAFQSWEKAIAQDPKFLFSYTHLATVYLEERRYKDLLEVARRALEVDPKWVTAYLFLGEAQAGLRDHPAAARAAQTATDLVRGKAPGPHLLLAKIRWEQRDCAAARRHLDRYLELNTSARELPEVQKSREMLAACR
jgi:tetratricopeptide (TPR) repeat protein